MEAKDEQYLETEIDYAIDQKRKKGDQFTIISLVVPRTGERQPEVPGLLQPYVWKEPKDDFDALECILNALPLRLPVPEWPQLP